MKNLDDLVGRTFGPFAVPVTADRVATFVAAVGEDAGRWRTHAPPTFANVALFSAAPVFLADPEVVTFTRSLIHSEQVFTWHRGLAVGETLVVSGAVTAARARGPLHLVTFEVSAVGDGETWCESTSIFLMSDTAATTSADEEEPRVEERPLRDGPDAGRDMPTPGSMLPTLACGASRLDLVRYAAASGDFNPIHWDHGAARAAGLPGVVVHGLLMASWMASAVMRHTVGSDPLREMRLRFRRPLRPAVAASVTGEVVADGVDVALVAADERLVTGRIRVTP